MSSFEGGGEGVELLPERHRHGVLKLRAAHLEHVAELDRLRLEGEGEVIERLRSAARCAKMIASRSAVG